MPRFSVLMPTHNRADVVGIAIASVLKQTETDFELLVVGDGCTDDTAAVVASQADRRIRWFDLPKGPHFGYANRNVALREASGEIVAFAAHDDLLFPDHLERLGAAFDDPTVEWCHSRPLWVSPGGVVVPTFENIENPDELDRFLGGANFLPASTVVHRRDGLDRYGFWPEDIEHSGDWDLWRRIIEGGGRRRLKVLREPTTLHFKAKWRVRPEQIPQDIAAFQAFAEGSSWWPHALKIDVVSGEAEQATFAALLDDAASAWVAAVRAAVPLVADRLARDADGTRNALREHLRAAVDSHEEIRLDAASRIERSAEELRRSLEREAGVRARLADAERDLHHNMRLLNAIIDSLVETSFAAVGLAAPSPFDEARYRALNADVDAAIREGAIGSGFEHFVRFGRQENRPWL